MAQFGAKYIKFNPIKEQPEDALPTFDPADLVQIGRLVKADLTVNNASGELYADDVLAESLTEFASGSLAVETDDMVDAVASTVYGCMVQDKLVHYNIGDTIPEGGLAYYKVMMRNGVKFFKGVFHPRVKAALGNDTAQTKGNSITFGTTSTTFTVFACNSGDWRITEEFEVEAQARAWVDKMLGSASAGTLGELTVASAAGANTGDTALTVTPEKAAGNLYKYKVGASATPVIYAQNVQSWTPWDGAADITAATGQVVTVVECGSDYKAVAAGSATVTAKE